MLARHSFKEPFCPPSISSYTEKIPFLGAYYIIPSFLSTPEAFLHRRIPSLEIFNRTNVTQNTDSHLS